MKRGRVAGVIALLLFVASLAGAYAGSRPSEPVWPSVAEQMRERRGLMSGHESWYSISNISRARNQDSILELPFRYRGDTLDLAIEAWWDVPRGRHNPDSTGRKRWPGVTAAVTPEEMLAARCVGPGRIDSMLVFAVARPQRADTFATPRLAWRVDTAARTLVPLSPVGLRCPTTPYFRDAVVTDSKWSDVRYAVTSWWDDVKMMVGRIAATHRRRGAGS